MTSEHPTLTPSEQTIGPIATAPKLSRGGGPQRPESRAISAQNHRIHGLTDRIHQNNALYLLEDEDPEAYKRLLFGFHEEHKPTTQTEIVLVRRLTDHEWLRCRALRFQESAMHLGPHAVDTQQLALYLRYQTTHERSFYKALQELQKIQQQKKKDAAEFESQKAIAQTIERKESHTAAVLDLKKQEFEWKKYTFHARQQPKRPQTTIAPAEMLPESSPGALKQAA